MLVFFISLTFISLISGQFFGDNRYVIRPVHASNKALEPKDGTRANGARIVQIEENSDCTSHQWLIHEITTIDNVNVYYQFENVHSGLYLTVENNGLNAGARIVQSADTNAFNQQFELVYKSPNIYHIKVRSSGLYLDINGGSTNNGAELIQWTLHGGNNQRFELVKLANEICTPSTVTQCQLFEDTQDYVNTLGCCTGRFVVFERNGEHLQRLFLRNRCNDGTIVTGYSLRRTVGTSTSSTSGLNLAYLEQDVLDNASSEGQGCGLAQITACTTA